MLKHIDPSKLSNGTSSRNNCIRGAKIGHVEKQIKEINDTRDISDVILHAGSNHLPKEKEITVINELCSLVTTAQKKFQNSKIHFSSIIPKYSNENINQCNRINNTMKIYCKRSGVNFIDNTNLFVNRHGIKFERLSRFDKLHLNKSGIIAMGKHLKYHIHNPIEEFSTTYGTLPPPYSPPSNNLVKKSLTFSQFF